MPVRERWYPYKLRIRVERNICIGLTRKVTGLIKCLPRFELWGCCFAMPYLLIERRHRMGGGQRWFPTVMPPTLCLNGPISIGGCVGLERLVASFLLPRAAPGNRFAARPFSVSFRCLGKRCAADMRSRRYGEWEGTLLFPKHIPIRSECTTMPFSDRDLGRVR